MATAPGTPPLPADGNLAVFQQPPGPPSVPPPMEAPEPQMEFPNTTPSKMHGSAAPKTEDKVGNKMHPRGA